MSRAKAFRFRLYVAGDTRNSVQARANLAYLCAAHLADCHHIEVIDLYADPARALADGVFMTPTLLRLAPGPVRRIIGTLSDTRALLVALDLDPVAA